MMMMRTADHQTQTDDAVEHDHGHRINRVARHRTGAAGITQHHRHHQTHFDDGDGQRQQDGAERVTDAHRQHFSVVHRREHGTAQQQHGQRDG